MTDRPITVAPLGTAAAPADAERRRIYVAWLRAQVRSVACRACHESMIRQDQLAHPARIGLVWIRPPMRSRLKRCDASAARRQRPFRSKASNARADNKHSSCP